MKHALRLRKQAMRKARGSPRPPDAAEVDIFRAAVQDVIPIDRGGRVELAPARTSGTGPGTAPAATADATPDLVYADTGIPPDVANLASFARAGQSPQVIRHLRRSHWPVDAELDLHGERSHEAHASVMRFISHAQHRAWRCLRIIHGRGLGSARGEGVLRGQVRVWLAACTDVLAFCEAPPAQGGSGALLVLLRKP